MIRFLRTHLRGSRALLGLGVGLTIVQVASELFAALPVKWLLDKLVNGREPSNPLAGAFATFFDRYSTAPVPPGEVHTRLGVVMAAGSMILATGLLAGTLAWAQLRIASTVAQRLSASLRMQLFARIESLPLSWHGRQRTGDLMQRLTSNVADIEKLVLDGLVDLFAGALTLVGIVTVMLVLSWQFTIVAILVVPFLFAVVYRYTLAIKRASKQAAKTAGKVAEIAGEDIRAITEVKAFGLENHEVERFGQQVQALRGFATRAGTLQSRFTPLVGIILSAATASVVMIGGWVAAGNDADLGVFTIPAGALTLGTLTVFLAYLKLLYQPMRNLSKLANVAANAGAGAERIAEVLNEEPEDLTPGEWSKQSPVEGRLRFEHVSFGYLPGRPVLLDIDIDIPAGKKVALVGLSGSGKTTMVKLIPRFHEAWSGRVLVDGVDTREMTLPWLRRNVSFVPQDSVLFEGTVRDNIALGAPGASLEQVIDAARQAHVHDQIVDLPDGYETKVEEGGKNLSTGQRQRLAIARAILRNTPILILDEPTASLDVEAEAEVMHALDTLIEGRTVLMISHRLSTLGHVDEIIVLHEGRIVEQGPPHELVRAGGRFARMLADQNRYHATLAYEAQRHLRAVAE